MLINPKPRAAEMTPPETPTATDSPDDATLNEAENDPAYVALLYEQNRETLLQRIATKTQQSNDDECVTTMDKETEQQNPNEVKKPPKTGKYHIPRVHVNFFVGFTLVSCLFTKYVS